MSLWLVKCLVMAGGLGAWFWTQAWLARRPLPEGLQDRVHDLTAPLHRRLVDSPRAANALLAFTSPLIDLAPRSIQRVRVAGCSRPAPRQPGRRAAAWERLIRGSSGGRGM